MADDGSHPDQLHQLQSGDQLKLLDEIDKLRSQGISHYVSLPQLIVCGDQSSGKSSSLEAISGISFPTKDNLCTRFATEVILRRAHDTNVVISIVPSQTRPEAECKKLLSFRETLDNLQEFPSLVDKANDMMGISATGNAFSDDVLRVEVSGPDRPHLTIVDLPGLIHSENKVQTAADVALVLGMVRQYMDNKRSIILAVISAKNDYANQIILKLAKEVDPTGGRTLGIITKPDTLSVGSESEAGFLGLARNEDVNFRLGWHVLRNRDYESRNSTTEARDIAEMLFFSQGIWQDLPRQAVGIVTLRERLSKVLLNQIKAELPSLVDDIQNGVEDCQSKLAKLGGRRTTLDEQRLFLLHISQSFQALCRAAVDGTYGDPFFGDPRLDEGYDKRLRAVVQNLNLGYADDMRLRGHHRKIVDSALPKRKWKVSREDFIDEIRELLRKSRGRELPGMFNPLIVGDIFFEQSKPWEGIARDHLQSTWDAVKTFLELTLAHLTDDITMESLFMEVVDPIMNQKASQVQDKLQDLMAQNQKGHPITYNHYFTETIQKVRQERTEKEVVGRLQSLLGHNAMKPIKKDDTLDDLNAGGIKVSSLLSALSPSNEAEMDRYACSEILICMEAYYKVALKQLVDGVTIQAVEACLLRGLENIMSPSSILEMDSDTINRIASEPQEHQQQREMLTRKLAVLNSGLETCRRYVSRSTLTRAMPLSPLTNDDLTEHDEEDSTSEEGSVAKPVEEKSESPRSRNDGAELFKGAFQPRSAVFGFPKPNTPQLAPSSSLSPQSSLAQKITEEDWRTSFDTSSVTPALSKKDKKKAMKGVLAGAVIEDRLEL